MWDQSLAEYSRRLEHQGTRRRELAPRTRAQYLGDCRRVARWMDAHGIDRPEGITASALEVCFRDCEWSPATRRRVRVAVGDWLAPLFPPHRSPTDLLDAPAVRPAPVPRLSQADATELVDGIAPSGSGPIARPLWLRDRAILEVLYGSGLRRQEACDLTVASVSFENEVLRVRGKGDKSRTVPLTEPAVDALRAWLSEGRPALVRPHAGTDDPSALFVSRSGASLDGSAVYRIVRRELARIGRSGGPHLLRHAAATHLLEGPDGTGGAHLRVVQEILGHETLATTQRYTGVTTTTMQRLLRQGHPRG